MGEVNVIYRTRLWQTTDGEVWSKADELYMDRCFQLAHIAEGKTSPNPLVGAVVVCDGKIIGEGFHHKAGEPHAEPNAINSVADKEMLKRATLYVSLEPCSHYGKTPPCADLIIHMGIPRVVVATLDPNPLVAGRGIKMMREAGIDVKIGCMESEALRLNRRFFTFQMFRRPYVVLKWAQTADGFIDKFRQTAEGGPVKISNAITKTLNHKMRTEEDAIMVATRTAVLDNPHLTITKWSGRNPVRILLDKTLKVPKDYKIFDGSAKTIIFTEKKGNGYGKNVEFEVIDFRGDVYGQVLERLYERNILSVIIEGGAQWLQTVIDSGVWDEAHIETGEISLGNGIVAPKL